MDHDQFIGQVQHRGLGSRGDAERATRATLETLAERMADGAAHNLAAQLPSEIGEHLRRLRVVTSSTGPCSSGFSASSGPTEAVMEMSAFLVALVAAGWRPGQAFPTGHALLAASGAAFSAVVFGQMANAFACRSATRPPGHLGWWSNRFLTGAVVMELAVLAGVLLVPAVADRLGHAPPPLAGFHFAVLAAPAVLASDRLHKAFRARRRRAHVAVEQPPLAVGVAPAGREPGASNAR